MGYTHYWNHTRKFSNADWARVEDAWSACVGAAQNMGLQLSCDNGETSISAHRMVTQCWKNDFGNGPVLAINGYRNDAHETFVIHKNGPKPNSYHAKSNKGFDFTKTAGKPYDAFVTAMLIWLETNFPKHITVRSDGEISDWQEGMDLAIQTFGIEGKMDYPKVMRFSAQWKDEILFGDKYTIMRRIDDAVCLLHRGEVIYEFHGQVAVDVAERGEKIKDDTKEMDWRQKHATIDRQIRQLAKGAEIIGGQAPANQIYKPADQNHN